MDYNDWLNDLAATIVLGVIAVFLAVCFGVMRAEEFVKRLIR